MFTGSFFARTYFAQEYWTDNGAISEFVTEHSHIIQLVVMGRMGYR